MKDNNIKIQSVPACENDQIDAMKILKKVDPRIERHQVRKIRRLRNVYAGTNQEKKKE